MADKGKLSGNDIIRATEQPRAARMHTRAGSDIAGTSDQSAGPTEIAARGGIARTSEPLAAGMTDFPGASSQSGGAPLGRGGASRAPPRRPILPPLQGNPADAPLQRACRSCNTPTTWGWVCRNTTTGLLVPVHLCQDCAREQQLRAELAALEERMLVAANILNNPFPIICEACGHPSGTNKNACRVCNPFGNATFGPPPPPAGQS